MDEFLKRLAEVLRQLPAELLEAHSAATPDVVSSASAKPGR